MSTLRVELRVLIDEPGDDWPSVCAEALGRMMDPVALVPSMEPQLHLRIETIAKHR
jgi:hypothetical protein